jgi:hypothetical protein
MLIKVPYITWLNVKSTNHVFVQDAETPAFLWVALRWCEYVR